MQRRIRLVLSPLILIFLLGFSCATKGLVTERYPESFYRIPKINPETSFTTDQPFIIYSDNQAGWRARDVFLNKSSWSSNWMFAVPFYQLYLIGNGVIGSINYLRHKPDYGTRQRLMVRDAVYSAAKNDSAVFIINVGDISAADGRYPGHWKLFLEENKIDHPLLNEVPYFPVIGNHEHANDTLYGYANFNAVFDYPRFYTIEFPDAVIIVLDSNYLLDQRQYIDDDTRDELFRKWFVSSNPQKPSWLEQQLRAYDKPFKIVAMHHPPISFGKHFYDWHNSYFGRDLVKKRKKLIDLFRDAKVQVVFSGHDHLYQHSELTGDDGHKIHFIVGGGGGTPLRNPVDNETAENYKRHYTEQGWTVQPVRLEKKFHYYVVKPAPDMLEIEVVEVTGDKEKPVETLDRIKIVADNKTEITDVR